MILCSIILMNPWLRYGHYARWHRIAGDIYSVAHVFSLYGSLGFLIKHTFHTGPVPKTFPENIEGSISHGGVYGGSVFTMVLWLYWLAGFLSLTLGIYHILRGEVQRHRSWMSVNYGTTMGAAFLRLNWACFGYYFPQYRMDEINNAAVILFIVTMLWVAAGHSSLAHHKQYSSHGFSSLGFTVVLWLFGAGCVAMVANQTLPGLVAYDSQAHTIASFFHVGSWSVGLVAGSLLIPCVLHNPSSGRGGLGVMYVAAAFCMFVSTSSAFSPPLSLSGFLLGEKGHGRMGDGHFYALLPRTVWELKAVSVLFKTALFALAMLAKDEARLVEWSLHSYGEIASYGLTLAVASASKSLFPTEEDAFAHAAVLSTLAGPLVAYIASIYVMKPEPEPISAVRNGLFWDLRRPGKAGSKAD